MTTLLQDDAAMTADVIVAMHVIYVGFVVLGEVAIVLGIALGWQWIRNFWFRALHTSAIALVVVESLGGIVCPLTRWEADMRQAAGQPVEAGSFLGRWAHRLLSFDAPGWVFTTAYCLFGALVVATLVWSPPRWPRLRIGRGKAR